MVVVLPEPLTPTTKTTAGGSATRAGARSLAARISSRCSRMRPFNSAASSSWWRSTRWRMRVQDLLGGAHADIGRDERGFELLEQAGIDLLLALEGVFESGDQAGAGLLHAALELLEEGWLLLDGAEKGLNHFEFILAVEKKVHRGGAEARRRKEHEHAGRKAGMAG